MSMPQDNELLRELHILVDQLLDGELSASECQRLEELVCSSPACSDHYVRMMQMNAGLVRGAMPPLRLGELQATPLGEEERTTAPALPDIQFNAGTDTATPAAMLSVPAYDEPNDSGWMAGIRQVQEWTFSHWHLPAVVVATTCLLGFVLWNSSTIAPEPSDDRRPPVVNSLQYDADTVTLALDKIGTVTIEGPTDFRMVGPLRARLNYGRITVHVTELTGHGFVVETPDGDVTDFGTKFSLNVSKGSDTKLIVREGAVDLRPGTWRQPGESDRSQRLVGGQAVTFNAAGNVQRVMSIFAGKGDEAPSPEELKSKGILPVITEVSDNLRDPETKSYYEIVPHGLREDAVAYVDRVGHEWNGIDKRGMPPYLVGADYVKPFNDDKLSTDVEITVELSRPAFIYVFFDARLPEPEWLLRDFERTEDQIGLDMRLTQEERPTKAPSASRASGRRSGIGPGKSVDHRFAIWRRKVDQPGSVVLGPKESGSALSGMYGIAATELSIAVPPRKGE